MRIEVSLKRQTLVLFEDGKPVTQYSVSTAKNGAGEMMDSGCTPRGEHIISEKIGAGCAINTVFIGRIPTGEIYAPALRELHPERDWIVTRILRLEGTEDGKNKGGNVDSHARYIYIHGAPDDVEMGRPGSHGCIRMRNTDVVELFDRVEVGTAVTIRNR